MENIDKLSQEQLLKEHEDRFQYLSDKLSIPDHIILCDLLELERHLTLEEGI